MLNKLIQRWCNGIMASRDPDVVIGDAQNPYLLRWWVWKRNRWVNLYLHRVLRSDDDRALHDHPWINMSYIVEGEYVEVTPISFINDRTGSMIDGIERTPRRQGTFKWRLPTALHRLELHDDWDTWESVPGGYMGGRSKPATTLFLTGPRVRTWGFRCPTGWVKWFDFTQKTPEGAFIAKGCGEIDPSLLARDTEKSGWWPKAPDQLPTPTANTAAGEATYRASVVNR